RSLAPPRPPRKRSRFGGSSARIAITDPAIQPTSGVRTPGMPEPDPAAASGTYASDVERLTGDILQQWRQRLRRRADDSPRTGDRGEYERLLVGALLRASSSADDTILPGLAAAAARYATRERRLDPTGLCDELSCLGEIVQSELELRQPSVDQ